MLTSVLIGALLAAQGAIEKAPVFRAEAYVVTQFVVFHNPGGGVTRGLTSANFQATVNKKPVAIEVSEDPKAPGTYVLSIHPPLELRDGKSHRIDIKIRNWAKADDKWRTLPLNWTAVFAKPGGFPGTGQHRLTLERFQPLG